MKEKNNSKVTGRRSESFATDWLIKNGYSIIKTNYTTPYGEVDIIAQKNDLIIFIEVKSAIGQEPIEAVTESKKRKIRNIALYYMQKIGQEISVRFDVITITMNDKDLRLNHIVDAF